MIAIGLLFVRMLCDFFKPRPRLEAEILILRHQLNVLQQRTPRRRTSPSTSRVGDRSDGSHSSSSMIAEIPKAYDP
jgi:hypothetical protein